MAEATGSKHVWLLVAIAAALLVSVSAAAVPERAGADRCNPECLPSEENPDPEPQPVPPPPGPKLLVINLGWNTGRADTSAPLEGSTIATHVEHLRNVAIPWLKSLSPLFQPWTVVPGGSFTINPPSALSQGPCGVLGQGAFQNQLLAAGDAVVRAAGFNVSSYSGIVFVYSRQVCTGLDGFTDPVAKRVALPFTKATQHELGHLLGLPDAFSLSCKGPSGSRVTLSNDCFAVRYGDAFDSMGTTYNGAYNAMYQNALGWMGTQVAHVNAGDFTRSWTLKPLSDSSPSGVRALRLVDGPTTLWIEYRQPTGGDTPRVPAQQGLTYGVLIHREIGRESAILDLTPQSEFEQPGLVAGQTWANPLGEMKLTVNGTGPTGATVTLSSRRVTVPNVLGLSPSLAQTVISGAGLWSSGWNPVTDPTCNYLGMVADQHPVGGTRVLPGTQVTLGVGEQDPNLPCL